VAGRWGRLEQGPLLAVSGRVVGREGTLGPFECGVRRPSPLILIGTVVLHVCDLDADCPSRGSRDERSLDQQRVSYCTARQSDADGDWTGYGRCEVIPSKEKEGIVSKE
jgi:hypothetical protein